MSNQYRASGEECFLIIHSAKHGTHQSIFDIEDLESVSQYKWSLSKRKEGGFYVVTHSKDGNRRLIMLHRLVTGERFKLVDHKDRDSLNNRKSNLREATPSQNALNSKVQKNNKLGIKGVHYRKDLKKYRASIFTHGKTVYLGCFYTADEAAEAYESALKEIAKEFTPPIKDLRYA